jgi:Cu/Ag efflux pump CusA
MWIVKLALNRPYTFIVAAILIIILGSTSIATTPTDVFPNIDIPVITVIWNYSGLPAKEMEQRITSFSEFANADGKRRESYRLSDNEWCRRNQDLIQSPSTY